MQEFIYMYVIYAYFRFMLMIKWQSILHFVSELVFTFKHK